MRETIEADVRIVNERTRIGQGVRGTVKKWDVRLDKVVGGLTVVGAKAK